MLQTNVITDCAEPRFTPNNGVIATGEELRQVYTLCRLEEAGVDFDEFLAEPWEVLSAHGQTGALESIRKGFLPLLPEQAAIARRLADEENDDG